MAFIDNTASRVGRSPHASRAMAFRMEDSNHFVTLVLLPLELAAGIQAGIMKTSSTRTRLLSFLSGLSLFAGTALARHGADDTVPEESPADAAAKFTAADTDSSGSLTLAEFASTFSKGSKEPQLLKKFAKADANADSLISLNEWTFFKDDSIPEQEKDDTIKFTRADADASGFLTLAEFTTTQDARKSAITILARFIKADTNADELLSLDEWLAFKDDRKPDDSVSRPDDFTLTDTDADGNVTLAEFAGTFPGKSNPKSIAKKFDKLDRNDDSLLTRDEWNPGKRRSL